MNTKLHSDISKRAKNIGTWSPFVPEYEWNNNEIRVEDLYFNSDNMKNKADLIEYVKIKVANLKLIEEVQGGAFYRLTEDELDKPIQLKNEYVTLKTRFSGAIGYKEQINGGSLKDVLENTYSKHEDIEDFFKYLSKYTYRDLLGL